MRGRNVVEKWSKMAQNNQKQLKTTNKRFCGFRLIIKKLYGFVMGAYGLLTVFYLPMQNIKFIDNQ